jgi:hypothetical protein
MLPLALLLLAPPASAGALTDDLSTDAGRFDGGVIADGVLTVTDGDAGLALGELTALQGRLRLRLREGDALRLQIGDAIWMSTYDESGGVSLNGAGIPHPPGHLRLVPEADPVIAPGPEVWDAGDALHCEVAQDPATGEYRLFWTGALPRDGYGYRQIGLATSPDAASWTRHSANPVLSIAYDLTAVDGVHVHMPTVVHNGAGWQMFYACYQNDVGNRICRASSPDGLSWTPEGVALDLGGPGDFDEGSLRQPDVLIGEDGVWHMLYNGTAPDEHYGPTGYATSTDGRSWTKHGPITADGARLQGGGMAWSPYGVQQWWNCDDAFCHSVAAADDLSAWTDDPEPVLRKGWAPWADGYIQAPSPLLIGTTWHLWFNGYTYTDTFERLGHARTEPVAGPWFELEFDWDGETLRVRHDGATHEAPLASLAGLQIGAAGAAELDQIELSWTEAEPDSGGADGGDGGGDGADGGADGTDGGGDGGGADGGAVDAEPAGAPADGADPKAAGCGVASGPREGAAAALLAFGAMLRRRRRA